MNSSDRFIPIKVVSMIALFIVIVVAASALVMFLWNSILTEVTNVKPLSFWQALGLLLLAKILFGGFGRFMNPGKKSRRRGWKNPWMGMNREEKKEWKKKWMEMNPMERKEAKRKWKEHCRSKRKDN